MTNRNPIVQWMITFPQSGGVITKDKFSEMLPPSVYSKCCEEEHEDGGVHLHLVIKFIKGITISKLLKWVTEKFPTSYKRIHMKGIKDMNASIDYVSKEDPSPFIRGTLEKVKKMPQFLLKESDKWIAEDVFARHQGMQKAEKIKKDVIEFFRDEDAWQAYWKMVDSKVQDKKLT